MAETRFGVITVKPGREELARELGLDGRGSGVARVGRVLGVLALSLALMAGLSVVFHEAVLYYQRHYR